MHVVLDRSDLLSAVTWASRALPARPTLPVLAGLRLTVTDDQLTVAGFDLEQSATATIPVIDAEPGQAVVPGRLFADIIKAVSGARVTITTDGSQLLVESGSAKYKLPSLNINDYPTLPDIPPAIGQIDSAALTKAARQVIPAASNESATPVLQAVRLSLTKDGTAAVLTATDRYRLAITAAHFQEPLDGAPEASLLVPARTLDAYLRQLPAGPVDLLWDPESPKTFGLASHGMTATTRLLDGDFPKTDGLIPTSFPCTAVVDREDFEAAAKRVALMAAAEAPIRLTFRAGEVHFEVLDANGTGAGSAEETIAAQYDGEEMTIGFNASYLHAGLTALDQAQVSVEFSSPTRPVLLTAAGTPLKYLLMPKRT